jgi:hypothetical protein
VQVSCLFLLHFIPIIGKNGLLGIPKQKMPFPTPSFLTIDSENKDSLVVSVSAGEYHVAAISNDKYTNSKLKYNLSSLFSWL